MHLNCSMSMIRDPLLGKELNKICDSLWTSQEVERLQYERITTQKHAILRAWTLNPSFYGKDRFQEGKVFTFLNSTTLPPKPLGRCLCQNLLVSSRGQAHCPTYTMNMTFSTTKFMTPSLVSRAAVNHNTSVDKLGSLSTHLHCVITSPVTHWRPGSTYLGT